MKGQGRVADSLFSAFRELQKAGPPMEMQVVSRPLAQLTPPPFENSRNSDYA